MTARELIELESLAENPYPMLHRLRSTTPIARARSAGGHMWLVTRRADVLEILRNPEHFSTDHPASPIRDTFGAQMLSAEGEAQRRFKSACSLPFNRRAVDVNAEPIVRARLDQLLDAIECRSDELVDLRATLAAPLALAVVSDVIGIPAAMHDLVREWYDAFAAALATHDPSSAARRQGRNSAAAFRAAVAPLIAQSSTGTHDALLGHLAHAAPSSRLDDAEILANTLIVLFGGIETTEAAILNAMWALLTHAESCAEALEDDRALVASIEESLRWEPAVQTCTRYAVRDVRVRDVSIREGEVVQCMIGGANRDPEHFDNPDHFDIRRPNAGDHVSFGFGRHYCLGAALARVEARLAIRGLYSRWPQIRLDAARDSSPRGHEFRKPPVLWVTGLS